MNVEQRRKDTRKRDAALKRKLYQRAAEMLREAAMWAEKKDPTWTTVYTEAGLHLVRAADSL